ncbi:hypothetical protein HanRHA438_Chr13g0581691 [Helianthus annuus]|nr:hypothetical protein HanRHA438_Chr13g0581691 [Helianthus annuus]
MYITACEIYDYIDMYVYKEFQKSIKNKAQAYVSMINLDFLIRNLLPISLIPISNIISFDHLPRNSSDNNNNGNPLSWDTIKSIRISNALP